MKIFTKILTITYFSIIIYGISTPSPLSAKDEIRKPITKKLIALLKEKPEIRDMLENSIKKAKRINPDTATNPVQTIYAYYDFIDETSDLIPRQILKDPKNLTRDQILQSICYFYFIIDQPLGELKDKKQFKNSLQFYDDFSPWLREFADTWGKFLDKEESWSKKSYLEFKTDLSYGLTKDWYESPVNWKSFNQFFSRKLRSPSKRPIASPKDSSIVTSPTDSVPQGTWYISRESKIMVEKGLKVKLATYYNINDLLSEDSDYKNAFAGGVLTHTVLNLNDYHRFHFAVDGQVKEKKIISKNVALEVKWDSKEGKYAPIDSTGWQFTQTRGYVIVETVKYGLVLLMPMGMAQISSVNFEKNVTIGSTHKKGDPLGTFLFGGSDFMMVFQKVANFQLTAGKDNDSNYKHLLMGSEYGIIKGDEEHLKKVEVMLELDKMASILKLPPLSGLNPSVTKSEVDLLIYKEIENSGIPAFEEDSLLNEAEKKYNLWKIGDEVTVIDLQGYKHEGKLTDKNSKYIKIGTKRIFAIDFTEKMLPHLKEDHRKAAIEKFISEKKKVYFAKRRSFKTKLRATTKTKFYNKYGFVNYAYKWMDYKTYKSFLIKELVIRRKKEAILKARKEAQETKDKSNTDNLEDEF